jgi:hypothetical protein
MADDTGVKDQMTGLLGSTEEEWSNYTNKLASESEPLPETTFRDVATFVGEMTPIIGDAMAAKDVYDELNKEEPNYYLAGALGGATIVGLVPGLGDAASAAIKKGAKEVFDVAKRVEVNPNAMGSMGGNISLKPKEVDLPDIELPPAENAARTQIAGTLPTYKKADTLLNDAVGEGRTLDFGAGLGLSKKELGFDTYEPFPKADFTPDFISPEDIPSNSYKKVTNLNVLNVVPREVRDGIVMDIGRILEPNGVAVITTRGRDVMAAKGTPGPEPMSIITSMDTYQKGFTQPELRSYITEVLGNGFEVANNKLGAAGVTIRKLPTETNDTGFAEGGLVKKRQQYAEGGLTMDDQMETVFKSSRAEVDPVSGNEVPLGARPEEVRDDIPANLSEGEYIVPADVLRYYGVKFFEDLRMQAKQGWQELDEGGRVGGEPSGMEMGEDELPFDISELQTIDDSQMGEQPEMNMGGYIKGYADGGVVDVDMAALQEEFPDAFTTAGKGSGQEYRTYTNAEGMTLSVRFVNGKPMSSIPAGYTASGETAAETAAPKRERKDRDTPTQQQPVERKDWATADASEFGTYLDQKDSLLGRGVRAIAGGINPLMGALISYAGNAEDKRVMEALDNRLAAITDPKDPEYKKLMDMKSRFTAANEKDTIKDKVVRGTGIYGGGKSMTDGLVDTSGDGKTNFGDTYLGDLLGFDGSMGVDAKDKDGNKIGITESVGGGRRDMTKKDTSPAPSLPASSPEAATATSGSAPKVTTTSLPASSSSTTTKSTNSLSGATSSGRSGDGSRDKKESYDDKISRGGGFMHGGYVSKKSKKK